MGRMKASAVGVAAALGAFAYPAMAQPTIAVLGGAGESCWRAAAAASLIHMESDGEEAAWKAQSIGVCDDALASAALGPEDQAATYVDLGSTMTNTQRYAEGVAETQLGLSLKSKDPQLAYYNLGVAYEFLGDLQKAYNNYKRAAALSPKWQAPKDEMARFVVQDITR